MNNDRALNEEVRTEESTDMNGDDSQHPKNISENTESTLENESISEEKVTIASPVATANDTFVKKPYYENYYLKYCSGIRTATMDLTNTKAFLCNIGFDGGELRQARNGKNYSEKYSGNDSNGHKNFCSYCGAEISGIEYYRLRDGRLRCVTCSRTVVTSKAEVEEMCNRVIANMETFFGASIEVPVSIKVLDEMKIKRRMGTPLGIKDSKSILILGVAIGKKNKYSILLENGAPRISLMATFAHELTDIWQYTHWDNQKKFKKCAKSKRLLIYEGMAKWAEIQYLYLIGETEAAKREEYETRNRKDEYGIGFCLYAEHYPLTKDTMTCEETPFTPEGYPFELKKNK